MQTGAPLWSAPAESAPYTHLARMCRRFPNLLYRRFPNRRIVGMPGVPVWRAACGLVPRNGTRDSRLGSLRHEQGRSAPAVAIETLRCVKGSGQGAAATALSHAVDRPWPKAVSPLALRPRTPKKERAGGADRRPPSGPNNGGINCCCCNYSYNRNTRTCRRRRSAHFGRRIAPCCTRCCCGCSRRCNIAGRGCRSW